MNELQWKYCKLNSLKFSFAWTVSQSPLHVAGCCLQTPLQLDLTFITFRSLRPTFQTPRHDILDCWKYMLGAFTETFFECSRFRLSISVMRASKPYWSGHPYFQIQVKNKSCTLAIFLSRLPSSGHVSSIDVYSVITCMRLVIVYHCFLHASIW